MIMVVAYLEQHNLEHQGSSLNLSVAFRRRYGLIRPHHRFSGYFTLNDRLSRDIFARE
ncbi:hypothetical protein Pla144_19910 [Bythopirellula polymerisocia]|uniref:Uncharacterized protein n=1 Tax=Bythopirellula polymerisocia TaxID=2528003 RepID=A0A5C6D1C3_9BACT|nr:hypothetical protein Pla144_19910 [Bythopirellula polymerisocia]